MLKKVKFYLVLIILLAIPSYISIASGEEGIEFEAVKRISEAEDSLDRASHSLLELEKRRGDIIEFVMLLNTALEHYARAEMKLEVGDFESAIDLADKAMSTSNMILEASSSMMVVTHIIEGEIFRNKLYVSFAVSLIIIISTFFSWKVFKRYYVQRIKNLRLEVVNGESH